ncbi:MAG: DUF2889 domain-containing protein [Thermodesulfobacteriota bacterium]
MIGFSRSMLVGAEFVGEDTIRLHGILEDHIYAMEIRVEVELPRGVIKSIQGWMKRYTNSVCPKAVDALQAAVGRSLREEGWISWVNREIGRNGCQHFAEILVECGRCLDAARLADALREDLKKDPSCDTSQRARSWVQGHPEAAGRCMARP